MSTPRAWAGAALAALLVGAYANHFHNGFHFDDDHAIVTNPYVRSLAFVPRYFVDGTTFSVLPLNQNYRPVTQTTFAVDYRLGGYDPRVFQIDTFVWFLALVVAVAALAAALEGRAREGLLAAAIFGLHPVAAETVNYVVQRGEVLAALGVVAGLWCFIAWPWMRPAAVYLVPVVLGLLAKQTAAAFPFVLAAYTWIFERRIVTRDVVKSMVVTAVISAWVISRTPATTAYLSADPVRYLLTQPFVALRYAAAFLAPVDLSVDYDWPLVSGVGDAATWAGGAFVAGLGVLAWRLGRGRATRAIGFGLAWFLIAQLPTALVPLTEVANNWRMFLPFVGLAIAAAAAIAECRRLVSSSRPRRAVLAAAVVAILGAEAVGVHGRNNVWGSDEALWREATLNSPENGRAWMNYGVALMARGDYAGSIDACERALPLAPEYPLLRVNLGVAYGAVGRRTDAEREFLAAQRLAPLDWRTHLYYAAWLAREGRTAQADAEAARARALNPVATSNQ